MKDHIIDKLLSEQATPEEEHQIAQMLKPKEEEMERWLTEDETATYDRLVSPRRSSRRLWWAAAMIAVILTIGGIGFLYENNRPADSPADHLLALDSVADTIAQPVATPPVVQTATVRRSRQRVAVPKAASPSVSTADSLQYYIARLERELEQVSDSDYSSKAEEIIRADARMQRLVQRIMMGTIEKEGQPAEAMANHTNKEELP